MRHFPGFSLFLALACATLFHPAAARADFWGDAWLDPALLEAQSLDGGSGLIHVPVAQSLPAGEITGALHRYVAKVGYGFPYGLEAGGSMELQDWPTEPPTYNFDQWFGQGLQECLQQSLLYARWSPLVQGPNCPIGLSVGFDEFRPSDVFRMATIPGQAFDERDYIVAGGVLPDLPMFYACLGYGGGDTPPAAFGALVFAPFPGIALISEYNEKCVDLGVRALLSTQIKLDLDLSKIQTIDNNQPFDNVLQNNVIFGVSYSEVWP